MINYLSYVSQQTYSLTDNALENLLKEARENNEAIGITGMLIIYEGLFIQYIEGPAESIKKLFEKISKDPRHKNLTELDKGSHAERQFADWSMAFERLTPQKVQELRGYKDFIKEEVFLNIGNKENPALQLLNSFVKNL